VQRLRYPVVGLLLLASAALQIQASLQRWVVARAGRPAGDVSIEDHRYDYGMPSGSWEPIGTAAQVHGAGLILLAAGVAAFGWVLPRGRRRLKASSIVAIAVPSLLLGINGVIAGLTGQVTGIGDVTAFLSLVNLLGFVGLAALVSDATTTRRAEAWVGAFLFGSSPVGYFIATFVIAPILHGDTSYATTPWTETVIGTTTAAAGLAALLAALPAPAREEGIARRDVSFSARSPER
jgi:hypothetical protein